MFHYIVLWCLATFFMSVKELSIKLINKSKITVFIKRVISADLKISPFLLFNMKSTCKANFHSQLDSGYTA